MKGACMLDKKLYGTATVGSKGQIVIPAEAREALSLQTGDRLYIAGSKTKKVLFCLKEDELRELVEQLTGQLESASQLIVDGEKERHR